SPESLDPRAERPRVIGSCGARLRGGRDQIRVDPQELREAGNRSGEVPKTGRHGRLLAPFVHLAALDAAEPRHVSGAEIALEDLRSEGRERCEPPTLEPFLVVPALLVVAPEIEDDEGAGLRELGS